MSSHAVELVRSRLHNPKPKSGGGWSAKCPGHNGNGDTSLSLDEGDDGRALLKCWAGCEVERVVSALGLTMADLFERRNGGRGGTHASGKPFEHSNASEKTQEFQEHSPGSNGGSSPNAGSSSNDAGQATPPLTLAAYAAAKQLPISFLTSIGLNQIYLDGKPAVKIPYKDMRGEEVSVRFRLAMTGENRFRWRKGSKLLPYGLWRLQKAKQYGPLRVVADRADYTILAEGESDCHTLWAQGFEAIGIPGADTWKEEWAGALDGIETIYLRLEPDHGGEAVRAWLKKSSIRQRVRLLDLGEHKDPSALYLSDPTSFKANMQAAMDAAEPWADIEAAEQAEEANGHYTAAKALLDDPRLLNRIGETISALGYAGDVTPPKLAYVAMTSRLLERPQNLAFVGPSAAGKNRAVDDALRLIPAEAVYLEKAGSTRALIYAEEHFEHRVVIVSEADSIPEDGPAATAIRSLAADNSMSYDVVEKNPQTGRHKTRHIVKPGPTGLITTSTKSLPTQMGTRVLEVAIKDDEQQTKAVMLAHADDVNGQKRPPPDLTPYLALQRWLALQGQRVVRVPYARTLMNLMPAKAVRMRRDSRQLLTCIQAIALLYQCQRQCSHDGAILATLEDYAEARALLAPVFEQITAEGLTPAIRQTVEGVQEGEEISEAVLASRLKLSKSTVSWRVNRALQAGWLVNQEVRKNHPKQLARGASLPDTASVLPTPEEVQSAWSKEGGEGGEGQDGSIRTGPVEPPFEQGLSVENFNENQDGFEGSNENQDVCYPPPPPPAEGTLKTAGFSGNRRLYTEIDLLTRIQVKRKVPFSWDEMTEAFAREGLRTEHGIYRHKASLQKLWDKRKATVACTDCGAVGRWGEERLPGSNRTRLVCIPCKERPD